MLKQILPVSIFFAISLVLSNKAYIYLSVSYIQVMYTLHAHASTFMQIIYLSSLCNNLIYVSFLAYMNAVLQKLHNRC